MNRPIKDNSYQISLQNIEYSSHHIQLGMEILLVIRGEIELTVNQHSFQLSENDLLLINANDLRFIKGNKENVVLSLQIPLDLIEPYYPNIHECYFDCNSSKEGNRMYLLFDQIRQLMAKILIAYYQKQDGSEIEINGLIFQLVTLLIRNFKTAHLGSHQFTEMKDERIREILTFIERNYRKPISLEEIAKQRYLSIYYLSRYFKQEVGVSFSQYVKNVRLKSAVHELLYTEHNITQISLNNGFPNVKAFNKAFRESYQQTPTEYRILHKAEPMDVEEVKHETEQYTLLQSPNFLMEISKYISGNEKSTTLLEPAASAVYVDLPQEPIFIKEKP